MIPQGFIQDLIARADIVDVVGRSVQLKKAGINYKGLCPFHGEKSPSFIVSPSRQTYHCFGCGAHGNAVGFLMEHGGMGFIDAVRDLAQSLGVSVPEEERSPEERARAAQAREQQATLGELLAKAAAHWRRQLKDSARAIDYLKNRGLTGEIAARFGMGYAPPGWHGLSSVYPRYDDPTLVEAGLVIVPERDGQASDNDGEARRYDRFRDRIMFPIRNPKGEVIGFGGRVLDGGEPKYLNSPETPVFVKGRELYGLFEARTAIRERGYALVTEGYMDVVALAQLGFPNAVATLGTACTAEHVQKLVRFTDQVVFSFDGDAAGRRAAGRALEAVLPHASDTRSFRFLFLPTEHDPDSYIREHGANAFEHCVANAVPLSTQLLDSAREGCDLGNPEGRAKMLAAAKPLFLQLPEGLLREQLLQSFAEQGGIGPDVLMRHWGLKAGSNARSNPAYDATDGSPSTGRREGRNWEGERQGGRSFDPEKRRWRGRDGSGFSRGGASSMNDGGGPRRAPPRTATLLDRAAWLLLLHADQFLQLSAEQHEALASQPAPYGEFFAALERLLHDQGSLPYATLLADLPGLVHDDASMRLLLDRLAQLHQISEDVDPAAELNAILQRLRLQAVEDELNLLVESGDLSEAANERRKTLYALQREIKNTRG